MADTIFVSPPWGGPKYRFCDTFGVLQPVEGLEHSIKELLEVTLAVVKRTARAARPGTAPDRIPLGEDAPQDADASGAGPLCAGVQGLFAAAAMNKQATPSGGVLSGASRFVSGSFDLAAIESGRAAAAAAPAPARARGPTRNEKGGVGVVALFLPRNTDLYEMESLVPQGSVWQVERNYVNGKLKGITVYCFAT